MTRLLSLVAAVLLLGACTPVAEPDPAEDPSPSSAPPPAVSPSATPPPRRPSSGECFRLTFEEALAPTSAARPVRCGSRHTSQTFHVGTLDLVVDGHLLAVDSERARAQVSDECSRRLAGHLSGSREALRLSILEATWFTPTVPESQSGAAWFRCDVVAVGGHRSLAPLPRRTRGLLADGPGAFRICGSAEPGEDRFERVRCSAPHSWRAIASVGLSGDRYPSAARAAREMGDRCRSAARAQARDPLDFTWSEERPSREQWRAGRRYGFCWVPD